MVPQPHFRDAFVFEGSKLASLRMGESTVTLDKPIFVGQCVLDNAKEDMFEWHYGYMKPKYGRVSTCYTDTDSFIYEIKTKDFYDDIREDVPKWFDTSAYPENHPARLPRVNKKVVVVVVVFISHSQKGFSVNYYKFETLLNHHGYYFYKKSFGNDEGRSVWKNDN